MQLLYHIPNFLAIRQPNFQPQFEKNVCIVPYKNANIFEIQKIFIDKR